MAAVAESRFGPGEVNWLLDNFVAQTDGVTEAFAVSSDGLLMARSSEVDRATADRLSAVICGMTSLAGNASRLLDKGPLRQVISEFGEGYLLVSAISDGSSLGVVTTASCDLGLVGYSGTLLVERIGALLTPELVTELKASLVR